MTTRPTDRRHARRRTLRRPSALRQRLLARRMPARSDGSSSDGMAAPARRRSADRCGRRHRRLRRPSRAAAASPSPSAYFTFSAAPDHLEDLDTIIAAFKAENPDIKIEVETARVRRLLHRAADAGGRRQRARHL